jgi:hypothetical protein
MKKFGIRSLAAITLLSGLATSAGAAAPPEPEKILVYKPIQASVEITNPSNPATCVVELEKGATLPGSKQATAWVLKDAQGKLLRKFHDTNGEGKVNVWSYYRDGEEAYREMDTDGNGKADQFRWLGQNGSKWGVDRNEDGKIDSWLVMSPEELSQEILAIVTTQDAKRLEALLMTSEDLKALGLPEAETARLEKKIAAAPQQFTKTLSDVGKLGESTVWVHLETKLPMTTPADTIGAKADYVRYKSGTILYQDGQGKEPKHSWLQTGEMVQVGKAWKLIQAPTSGMNADDGRNVAEGSGTGGVVPKGADKLVKEIQDLDAEFSKKGVSEKADIIKYNLKRAATLEKIVPLISGPDQREMRDIWAKQIADCYAAAAQQGDKSATSRLGQWREALGKEESTKSLAGYFIFREMTAEYSQKMPTGRNVKPDEMQKIQEDWLKQLQKFITDYPRADDTPDALMQLGMGYEFMGKETEAKNSYSLLVKDFARHPMAKKAQGCLDRLTLEGRDFVLSGPMLGTGTPFNVNSLKGKFVVVYYWASWNDSAATDFKKFKLALAGIENKVEIVGVNLDNKAEDAIAFVQNGKIAGNHLYQPGGLESPFATQYGVTVLPNTFLVGPDGKVISRAVAISTLDDELKKLIAEQEKK